METVGERPVVAEADAVTKTIIRDWVAKWRDEHPGWRDEIAIEAMLEALEAPGYLDE